MGSTRDLFKKSRDTKGPFHAKTGSIKDRNGMDLREVDLKKRWQEYTEELYKKDLHRGFSIHGVSQARILDPGDLSGPGFKPLKRKKKKKIFTTR